MANGKIIFVHRDEKLLKRMEEAMCRRSPQIHVERTTEGGDAVMMQAFLRADVVVLDSGITDVSAEYVVYALKRDVVNPYVVVYERKEEMHRRWLALGVDRVIGAQTDVILLSEELERQIKGRSMAEGWSGLMAERLLQRLFAEYGIPCSLKGYRFLKSALEMLAGVGQTEIEKMNSLYERIGEKHGCSAACVERNMRYVIELCWSRSAYGDHLRPSNAAFIAQILEDAGNSRDMMFDPKISIYCSERRIFK